MPRGGARKPGEGKAIGRPKQQRPTNANVAQKVLAAAKAEQLWVQLIDLEKKRLQIDSDGKKDAITYGVSIMPLVNLLKYLECRAYGNPVDTVNHLHDKPIELDVKLSLGERMKSAMEKAEQRVKRSE